ncbi:MAG TPA: hypothetical protein VG204_15730 [Terriglobia bacterium]|nr:hypothetical protein [Terriglobia bacterium]
MTAIVGLFCSEGIVIASESQESEDEIGLKRLDVTKVYDTKRFGFTDVEIIVAGTGTSAYIARAAELIAEKGYAPHFPTPRSVANLVEDCMGDMKTRYGDKLDLELLVGVYCKQCPLKDEERDTDTPPPEIGLFSISAPEEEEKVGVAESITDYSSLGSGGLFARYLLNRLHDEDHSTMSLDMDSAIREAAYVVEEVKKVDLWCGGPTQLICIRKSGDSYVLERKKPKELAVIATEMDALDQRIKQRQRLLFSPPRPGGARRNR